MAYTMIDVLDKLITIEQNSCILYKNISKMDNSGHTAFKSAAGVLAAEEERHVEMYKTIRESLKENESLDIEIDFNIYDKASELIIAFKKRMAMPDLSNVNELLKFAFNFEKENISLILDIQGRLVMTDKDSSYINYALLSNIVKEEQKHADNIGHFLKKE